MSRRRSRAGSRAYLNVLGYDAYPLTYGLDAMCFDDDAVCTTKWHATDQDYPVVD